MLSLDLDMPKLTLPLSLFGDQLCRVEPFQSRGLTDTAGYVLPSMVMMEEFLGLNGQLLGFGDHQIKSLRLP